MMTAISSVLPRMMFAARWWNRRPIDEPAWAEVLPSVDEQAAAASYWVLLTAELRRARRLRPACAHALLRLVVARVLFDRASAQVLRDGAFTRIGERSGSWAVLQEASAVATRLEAELGFIGQR